MKMRKSKKGGAGLFLFIIIIVGGFIAYSQMPEFKEWVDNAMESFKEFKETTLYFCTEELIAETNPVCATVIAPVCGSDGIDYETDCGICIGKDTAFSYKEGAC